MLKNIANGLYMAVRHIEAVCVTALKRASEQDRQLKKEAVNVLRDKRPENERRKEVKSQYHHSLSIHVGDERGTMMRRLSEAGGRMPKQESREMIDRLKGQAYQLGK